MTVNHRGYVRYLRYLIQWAIFFLVIYGGYRFYLFVRALEEGILPSFKRPSLVDGFMPIGGLMGLKLWIAEGILDPVHPAAVVILAGALLISFFMRKAFCGWICPVGTLSELVFKTGKRIWGRNFTLPLYVDYPLRTIKYILMAFFLYVILIKMTPESIKVFLQTPYWKVADIKLLKFFTEMPVNTATVLGGLFVLSLFYKNFWCRYLCPYGALLGLLALAGPSKIKRYEDKCINCKLCSRNCPSNLPVDRKTYVHSPECTGCLTCVSYCPSKDCLEITFAGKVIAPALFIAIALCIFYGLIIYAMATGNWSSRTPHHELLELIPFLERLMHP